MTLLAENFEAAGMLPIGRDARWAMTVLYALVGPETWHLSRVELGDKPAAYAQWLQTTLDDTFEIDGR
ncbi:MAG: hypothetical protein ABIQ53_07480 [Terracoccus sp.]